jgi:Arc/MetJ-type ribon-helix-helix transcriptional regulator
MATSKKLSISLPLEQIDLVRRLAQSGRYASVSAVISDSLRVLEARYATMERWLRDEVVPAYDELRADPSLGLTVNQARAELARQLKART